MDKRQLTSGPGCGHKFKATIIGTGEPRPAALWSLWSHLQVHAPSGEHMENAPLRGSEVEEGCWSEQRRERSEEAIRKGNRMDGGEKDYLDLTNEF
ncbi:uncharacterized protein SPSK_06781 [Sporothrix schenckii 1099-18]|uniref:Uncharacterized protein n=1 Tax=Sporothrix schenckii 1099-18 TaxID=1397361 RepID=A0A0F2MJ64_SPOSC|nr:uncharacterized protein SPSK_06781 [Sporothrix schenckii 1099-18]KJR89743.1 hypothetical protein SPSK_06781 [Sporothrix schenckii 1099-18]